VAARIRDFTLDDVEPGGDFRAAFGAGVRGVSGGIAHHAGLSHGNAGQGEAGQRQAGEGEAKRLQPLRARDRLHRDLGEFIELVVHNYPYVLVDRVLSGSRGGFVLAVTPYNRKTGKTLQSFESDQSFQSKGAVPFSRENAWSRWSCCRCAIPLI